MKLFISAFLLAGATVVATPTHAQQAIARPATGQSIKPATNQRAGNTQTAPARTADTKLTWQQRRAIKKKKLTPYAEAMLHNELLREEPKTTGTGLL